MKKVIMAGIMFVSLVVVSSIWAAPTEEEQKCFDAINAYRASLKLPPVEFSESIYIAAKGQSMRMRQTRNFSHGLVGLGGCAECIARGGEGGLANFTMWKNSSGHRAILVGRSYTHAAVASDGSYWTYRAARGQAKEKTVAKTKTVIESTFNPNLKAELLSKQADEDKCFIRPDGTISCPSGTCKSGNCSGATRTRSTCTGGSCAVNNRANSTCSNGSCSSPSKAFSGRSYSGRSSRSFPIFRALFR